MKFNIITGNSAWMVDVTLSVSPGGSLATLR